MYNISKYKELFDTTARNYLKLQKEKVDILAIDLKINHTYRVVENMKQIAKSCKLNEHDMFIATIIALFHDIGRFKQYDIYKSFVDKDTLNHAKLSTEILENEDVLRDLNVEDKKLILKSVYLHNVYVLPEDLTKNELLFIDMIRDADRIDIYKGVSDANHLDSKEDIHIWYADKSTQNSISDKIYNMIMNGKSPSINDVNTVVEFQVTRLSWMISDMKFKEAIKIVNDNKYIEKVYTNMPKLDRHDDIYNYINKIIKSILKNENEYLR